MRTFSDMAADTVIRVEGLGKKYLIGHRAKRERYTALRDVIAGNVKARARSAANLLRGRPIVTDARQEEFWALKDINFEVKRGEVLGIIGCNGAGKSTLLKVLSRITEPTEGRVKLKGRVASLLEVGTGFHSELTGRENIYLNASILGMSRSRIRAKFDEIVDFASVEKFLDTPVKRYSSGMYVRLAFAVAAHMEPEILVVDEVLAVGDAQFQRKCLGKMGDVGKSGRTVLFVSHTMAAVHSLCGAGILLHRGRLVQSGPVAGVVREYLDGLSATGGADRDTPVELGPSLLLERFQFASGEAEDRAPASLSIRLVPKRPTTIREMAVLVYSENGVRVALLDLRRRGFLRASRRSDPFELAIRVNTAPLVEGHYRLGIYVSTDEYDGNYLDLRSFSVPAPRLPDDDPAQYPARERGFVDLEYSVQGEEPWI